MNDNVKIKGYLKIETLKDGVVVDTWEKHNLITNVARNTFAKLLAGVNTQNTINKFKMGTKGHVDTDVMVPKDSSTGFDETRTDLFAGSEENEKGTTWNELTFTPSGNITQSLATNVQDNSSNTSTVNITVTGLENSQPSVTYIFNIAQDAFNGSNGVIYTEAGLFADDQLIAMRTFKGRPKDSSTSFRITWNIIF